MIEGGVGLAVDLFGLEGCHDALGLGVIIKVGDAALAEGDAAHCAAPGVFEAGILGAAVGVVDQAVHLGVACIDRHVERIGCQPGFEMIVECPADDLAAERTSTTAR